MWYCFAHTLGHIEPAAKVHRKQYQCGIKHSIDDHIEKLIIVGRAIEKDRSLRKTGKLEGR